jgi:hypothetical protein
MSHIKTLGLAALAAMALMALTGTGTASATVLCSTAANPCGASSTYGAGTTIEASLDPGTTAMLSTTGGSIENTCTQSTVKGNSGTTGGSSETIWGTVSQEHLTFGGCTNPTSVDAGGELEVHWLSGTHNGTLTAKNFSVTVKMANFLDCFYTVGESTDLGVVTGGSMATVDVHAVIELDKRTESHFLCAKTVIWDAKYTVTSPEPLFIEGS